MRVILMQGPDNSNLTAKYTTSQSLVLCRRLAPNSLGRYDCHCPLSTRHQRPITWKKAQFEDIINFRFDTIQLMKAKIQKLLHQTKSFLQSVPQAPRVLERTIGSLVWATSICLHFRPQLASLLTPP